MGRVKGEENQHPYRLWDVVDLITARFRDNVQEDNATFRQDVATDFVEVQASSTPREAQSTSAFVSASAKENGGTVATEPHNISATEKVADENELPPGEAQQELSRTVSPALRRRVPRSQGDHLRLPVPAAMVRLSQELHFALSAPMAGEGDCLYFGAPLPKLPTTLQS